MRSGVGGGESRDREEEEWGGRGRDVGIGRRSSGVGRERVVIDSWSGVGRGELG